MFLVPLEVLRKIESTRKFILEIRKRQLNYLTNIIRKEPRYTEGKTSKGKELVNYLTNLCESAIEQ